jgi:peptide deformylase
MIREIIHDPIFLRQKSREATPEDLSVAADLRETLFACRDRCAGMAANMIGEKIRIIAFCNGPLIAVMMNPKIISKSGEYFAEEGCLSLSGVRQTRRYRKITVVWQDMEMKHRMIKMEGFAAQIVQHEIDHCDGILI